MKLFKRNKESIPLRETAARGIASGIIKLQQWFSGDYVVILEDATRLRLSRHYRDRVEKQVGV